MRLEVRGKRLEVGVWWLVVGGLALGGCATREKGAWRDELTGKNVTAVAYRQSPVDVAALVGDVSAWNWNFRPYGSGADSLWSDPKVQRDVSQGVSADGRLTALNVSCDKDAITVLVLCNEPRLADYFAKTNAYPGASIEFYVQPGDADDRRVRNYNWFYYDRNDTLRNGQWMREGRRFRQLAHVARLSETAVGRAVVARFELPWEAFWDDLPVFSERRDNFWRMGIARWGGAGGVTYGGEVHQTMRGGYISFPAFTEEQKTEILAETLRKGWDAFLTLSSSRQLTLGGVFEDGEYLDKQDGGKRKRGAKFRAELNAKDERSYLNYPEDPAFRPVLEKLVNDRKALAGDLARFREMAPAERDAFYAKASEMLFNFRYDVEEAYAKYQKERLMK